VFHEELQLSKICAYGLDDEFFISTDRFSVFFGTMNMSTLQPKCAAWSSDRWGRSVISTDFTIREVSLRHSKRDGL